MTKPPESTKSSLRLGWPVEPGTLARPGQVDIRFRGGFAYVDGHLADGTVLPLCRLRYGGYANQWGFAIWLASKNGYADSYLPTGSRAGTAEDALNCACGLYLNDPATWQAD